MKKSLALVFGVIVALMVAPSANAAVSTAFQNTSAPQSCVIDTGIRYCGGLTNASPSLVPSWDGTPLDVVVAYPADPGPVPPDGNFPIVGTYHGWGGNKINLKTDPVAQALLANGVAVFSMTDRGWWNSCGGPAVPIGGVSKPWPCTQGYIHLMHNAYEVRDAQYMLGQLADDRNDANDADMINPTMIGATGGSYGGGISSALAMLKNRIQLQNGQLVAWKSPKGKSMAIAAATPQYTWSDLTEALVPNGSTLDYASNNTYKGPNGDHRAGVDKQQWVFGLYASGLQGAYYAPVVGTGYPDSAANMIGWYGALSTGGPYDGNSTIDSMLTEIQNNHSSYYIPVSAAQLPAPMLISGGWNDDLFPFNEAVRLYNKIRAIPGSSVNLWGIDIGHTPRSNTDAASRTADGTPLTMTQVGYYLHYLKGGPLPLPNGQARATSSLCSGQTRAAGALTTAATWAAFSSTQVTVAGNSEQTIEPGTHPSDQFVSSSTDVCDYAGRTDATEGAASYASDPAGSGGYTLIGSPTVEADLNVTGANDQIVARLYDYDPAGIGHQRLISRAVYRPTGVGGGFSRQVFQLFPQNYKIDAGHTVKLELLSADAPFMMPSKNVHQQPIEVKNMRLSLPVSEANGSAGGQVVHTTPKELPAGYTFSADALATDVLNPITIDDVPATLQQSVKVTLNAVDRGISGIDKTYYEIGATPAVPTNASPVYDPNNKPSLANGEKISYFSVDRSGNAEAPSTSIAAQVDSVPPAAPTLVSGPSGTVNSADATIAFSAPELGASNSCSLDGAPTSGCASPVNLTGLAVGAHTFRAYATDSVGNVSTPLVVTWTVEGVITASVKVSGTAKVGKTLTATGSAKWGSAAVNGAKITYTWTAGGKKVGSKNKLKLSSKWAGKKIVVKVTASQTGYKSGSASKTVTSKLKK